MAPMPCTRDASLPHLNASERSTVLRVAADSIRHGLASGRPLAIDIDQYVGSLRQERSTFITLKHDGKLRGCIGSLEPLWPLVIDTARHAFAAAFSDPRFPPLATHEVQGLSLHISVLSPHEPLAFDCERTLISSLRPGVDGLVIHCGARRATFLPAVWESVPTPAAFLAELKRKAGMSSDDVPDRAERYYTESFGADQLPEPI